MPDDVFGVVGTVLSSTFRVEDVVAEGGFGVVYRAHHTGFRAPVALKCLKVPERLAPRQQRSFLDQFRGEAELMFRLSASIPNIVRPLHVDAFVTPSGQFVPFIALEWLDGQTLDALVAEEARQRGRPPDVRDLIELLTPVARALERAHHFAGPDGEMIIVHRDLKPENIFVAQVAGERIVKILDFGIAKAKSVVSSKVRMPSVGLGDLSSFSPGYGAPEQWLPKRFGQTGPWTDVWGLALSMVELLVGRHLIEGDRTEMMSVAIDPTRRPTPRTFGVTVSDAVEAVFVRALAVEPDRRYSSVAAFWSELRSAAGAPRVALLSSPGHSEPRHTAPSLIGSEWDGQPEAGLIPDLDLPPVSQRAVAVSAAPDAPLAVTPARAKTTPSSRSQEFDLEFELPAASVALELDERELADARIRSSRSSQSMPRVVLPSSPELRIAASGAAAVASVAPGDRSAGVARTSSPELLLEAPPSRRSIPSLEAPPAPPKPTRPSLPELPWVEFPGGSLGPRAGGADLPEGVPVPSLAAITGAIRVPSSPDITEVNTTPEAKPAIDGAALEFTDVKEGPPPTPELAGSARVPSVSRRPEVVPAPVGAAERGLMRGFSGANLLAMASEHMSSVKAEHPVLLRAWKGVALLAASVFVTLLDQVYAASAGQVFALGPIRAVWIAGLLMLAGLAMLAYKLFPRA